jgi:hypothetical protein
MIYSFGKAMQAAIIKSTKKIPVILPLLMLRLLQIPLIFVAYPLGFSKT